MFCYEAFVVVDVGTQQALALIMSSVRYQIQAACTNPKYAVFICYRLSVTNQHKAVLVAWSLVFEFV
jgi:3-oxoacyl-[acyl-carrier-protein] synthase III